MFADIGHVVGGGVTTGAVQLYLVSGATQHKVHPQYIESMCGCSVHLVAVVRAHSSVVLSFDFTWRFRLVTKVDWQGFVHYFCLISMMTRIRYEIA